MFESVQLLPQMLDRQADLARCRAADMIAGRH
jgi:hypothetical protein